LEQSYLDSLKKPADDQSNQAPSLDQSAPVAITKLPGHEHIKGIIARHNTKASTVTKPAKKAAAAKKTTKKNKK
jgi:hypothetical protein